MPPRFLSVTYKRIILYGMPYKWIGRKGIARGKKRRRKRRKSEGERRRDLPYFRKSVDRRSEVDYNILY
jgi:hypothetical protein